MVHWGFYTTYIYAPLFDLVLLTNKTTRIGYKTLTFSILTKLFFTSDSLFFFTISFKYYFYLLLPFSLSSPSVFFFFFFLLSPAFLLPLFDTNQTHKVTDGHKSTNPQRNKLTGGYKLTNPQPFSPTKPITILTHNPKTTNQATNSHPRQPSATHSHKSRIINKKSNPNQSKINPNHKPGLDLVFQSLCEKERERQRFKSNSQAIVLVRCS